MSNSQIVYSDLPYGVLVWKLPDGAPLANEDGDVLSLECYKGDLRAYEAMRKEAAALGYPEGECAFLPGSQQLTQSEWEDSMAMFLEGLTNPWDDAIHDVSKDDL